MLCVTAGTEVPPLSDSVPDRLAADATLIGVEPSATVVGVAKVENASGLAPPSLSAEGWFKCGEWLCAIQAFLNAAVMLGLCCPPARLLEILGTSLCSLGSSLLRLGPFSRLPEASHAVCHAGLVQCLTMGSWDGAAALGLLIRGRPAVYAVACAQHCYVVNSLGSPRIIKDPGQSGVLPVSVPLLRSLGFRAGASVVVYLVSTNG